MASVLIAARVLLAAVFATAGLGKLLDRSGARAALEGFRVPEPLIPSLVLLLPLAELATAIALLPQPSAQWGGVAALVLLIGFIGGIASALARGTAPDCHCFGQIHSEPAGRKTLIRNVVLAAVAGLVVVRGPGPSITTWTADRSPVELVGIGAGILVALLAAQSIRLWRKNRTLTDALGSAQAELASLPAGLPIGAVAPGFTLPSVTGETVTLEALLGRGRPVVLVFASPDCGPCAHFLPMLGGWHESLAENLTVAVISSGTAEENLSVARQTGGLVLLRAKQRSEVTRAYRIQQSPSTVVVTPEGRIANAPAAGSTSAEALIRLTLRRQMQRLSTPELHSAQPVG